MAKRLLVALSSSAKKLRNSTLSPQYRAEQFPNDFCVSGEQLFCRFCQHSIDWKRENTCSDHIMSKSHVRNKEKFNNNASKTTSLQTCNTASTFKSSDSRKEVTEDFVYSHTRNIKANVVVPKLQESIARQNGQLDSRNKHIYILVQKKQTKIKQFWSNYFFLFMTIVRGIFIQLVYLYLFIDWDIQVQSYVGWSYFK
uniref:U1-type domain-containing protein n=1 Tax=Amphiprion percula TaxID=161767 RepID=A0A3P8SCX6_AMPPE